MQDLSKSQIFILEWLNHFAIPYGQDVEVDSTISLDFLIDQWSLGILIVDWKRPISVQVINKALTIVRKLELDHLYLIAREISEPAQNTIEKYGHNITTIHPNGLSDLAMTFANYTSSSSVKQPVS